MPQLTLFDLGFWQIVKDGHPIVADIYKRHYSAYAYRDDRRRYGYRNRHLVMGPGEKVILLSVLENAIFGWRKFIDDSDQKGVNCAFFRNESNYLSSDLIVMAQQIAAKKWPGERVYTYVNPLKIKNSNPGYCFKCAGWKKCGKTKKGLIVLESRLSSLVQKQGDDVA